MTVECKCKSLLIPLLQVNYYERSLERMRQSMELEQKDICQTFKVNSYLCKAYQKITMVKPGFECYMIKNFEV